MKLKQKFALFPWTEAVHEKLQTTFLLDKEQVLGETIHYINESAKSEFSSIMEDHDYDRAQKLRSVLKDYVLQLHVQNLFLTNVEELKNPAIKFLSCVLDLYFFLSGGDPESVYLEYAISDVFLCLNGDTLKMWDVLLHCNLLKKKYSRICYPVLRRILNVAIDQPLEPDKFMEYILLLRLWKVFSPNKAEKCLIVNLAAGTTCTGNFLQYLGSLYPLEHLKISQNITWQKLANFFICRKFPSDFFTKMRKILREDSGTGSQACSSTVLTSSEDEALFFIDRGQKLNLEDTVDESIFVPTNSTSNFNVMQENSSEESCKSDKHEDVSLVSNQEITILEQNIGNTLIDNDCTPAKVQKCKPGKKRKSSCVIESEIEKNAADSKSDVEIVFEKKNDTEEISGSLFELCNRDEKREKLSYKKKCRHTYSMYSDSDGNKSQCETLEINNFMEEKIKEQSVETLNKVRKSEDGEYSKFEKKGKKRQIKCKSGNIKTAKIEDKTSSDDSSSKKFIKNEGVDSAICQNDENYFEILKCGTDTKVAKCLNTDMKMKTAVSEEKSEIHFNAIQSDVNSLVKTGKKTYVSNCENDNGSVLLSDASTNDVSENTNAGVIEVDLECEDIVTFFVKSLDSDIEIKGESKNFMASESHTSNGYSKVDFVSFTDVKNREEHAESSDCIVLENTIEETHKGIVNCSDVVVQLNRNANSTEKLNTEDNAKSPDKCSSSVENSEILTKPMNLQTVDSEVCKIEENIEDSNSSKENGNNVTSNNDVSHLVGCINETDETEVKEVKVKESDGSLSNGPSVTCCDVENVCEKAMSDNWKESEKLLYSESELKSIEDSKIEMNATIQRNEGNEFVDASLSISQSDRKHEGENQSLKGSEIHLFDKTLSVGTSDSIVENVCEKVMDDNCEKVMNDSCKDSKNSNLSNCENECKCKETGKTEMNATIERNRRNKFVDNTRGASFSFLQSEGKHENENQTSKGSKTSVFDKTLSVKTSMSPAGNNDSSFVLRLVDPVVHESGTCTIVDLDSPIMVDLDNLDDDDEEIVQSDTTAINDSSNIFENTSNFFSTFDCNDSLHQQARVNKYGSRTKTPIFNSTFVNNQQKSDDIPLRSSHGTDVKLGSRKQAVGESQSSADFGSSPALNLTVDENNSLVLRPVSDNIESQNSQELWVPCLLSLEHHKIFGDTKSGTLFPHSESMASTCHDSSFPPLWKSARVKAECQDGITNAQGSAGCQSSTKVASSLEAGSKFPTAIQDSDSEFHTPESSDSEASKTKTKHLSEQSDLDETMPQKTESTPPLPVKEASNEKEKSVHCNAHASTVRLKQLKLSPSKFFVTRSSPRKKRIEGSPVSKDVKQLRGKLKEKCANSGPSVKRSASVKKSVMKSNTKSICPGDKKQLESKGKTTLLKGDVESFKGSSPSKKSSPLKYLKVKSDAQSLKSSSPNKAISPLKYLKVKNDAESLKTSSPSKKSSSPKYSKGYNLRIRRKPTKVFE